MSQYLKIKQLQKKIGCAAGMFASCVIAALKEWMKAADDLRGHAQYACPEATRQMVQAALQQFPCNRHLQHPPTVQQHYQLYRPWVEKHLPGISKAMQECTRSQLDTSNKRISILQSLFKTSQLHDRPQLQSRLHAECAAQLLVEIQWWVLCIIMPVAVLCDDLEWMRTSKEFPWCMSTGRVRSGHVLKDDGLALGVLAYDLKAVIAARDQLKCQVSEIRGGLCDMGVLRKDGPPRHMTMFSYVYSLVVHSDLVWLHAARKVLPDCELAVVFVKVMFGPTFGPLKSESSPHILAGARNDCLRLLAAPGVLPEVHRSISHVFIGRIMQGLEVNLGHFGDAGVPLRLSKELLSMMEAATAFDAEYNAEAHKDQSLGDQPATRSDSAMNSSQQGVGGNMGSTAAGSTEACVASLGADNSTGQVAVDLVAVDGMKAKEAGGADLDSMQALLQLMYGCTV